MTPGGSTDGSELVTAFEAQVVGRVVGPSGEALPHTTVLLYANRSPMPAQSQLGETLGTAESDEAGRFRFTVPLPCGPLVVRGRHPSFVTAQVAGIDPSKPATLKPILRLGEGHLVSGRVVHTDGQPIEGVRVVVHDLAVQAFDPEDRLEREGVTNRDGEFSLTGLGGGIKRLIASAPGFGTQQLNTVRVPEASTGLTLTLGEGLPVMGRVIENGSRTAVAGVRVLGRLRGGNATPPQTGVPPIFATVTNEEGAFVLDGLPPGAVELWAQGPSFMAGARQTVQAGTMDLVLTVDPPIVLSGRVVRAEDQEPISRYRIMASPSASFRTGASRPLLIDDATGQFVLGGLGAWPEIHVFVDTPTRPRTHFGPLRLRAGEQRENIEIAVARGAILHGVVQDQRGQPVAGVEVEAASVIKDTFGGVPNPLSMAVTAQLVERRKTRTGPEGTFTFEGLAAGEWDLVGRSPTHTTLQAVRVDLPDEGTVHAEPLLASEAGAIRAHVRLESGEPDAQARVRLIGVTHPTLHREGHSDAQGQILFAGLPPGSYRLIVFQRNGQVDLMSPLLHARNGGTGGEEHLIGAGQTLDVDL